jgi:hypothetical protein
MRRFAFAAAAAALLLAACGPAGQDAAKGVADAAKSAASTVFPDLNAGSYRLEATMTDPDSGRATSLVQYRSGANVRMEMGAATTIINGETKEALNVVNAGGRTMAMRIPLSQADVAGMLFQADPASQTFVGPCAGAGEVGAEWARVDPEDGARSLACLTADGVLLKASTNGQTTWETTSVQRGAQDPALFALPAGVQVMDLGAMAGQGKAP